VEELRRIAISGGFRPMLVDGLVKAAEGMTTVDEIAFWTAAEGVPAVTFPLFTGDAAKRG
jgi:hypothetical protein